MPNTARTQMALADSPHFQSRLQAALAKVARAVIADTGAANYSTRKAFARQVLNAPGSYAAQLAAEMAMSTNVFAFNTSYDFEIGSVVTAAGDPDLESQLTTDWNTLAGV